MYRHLGLFSLSFATFISLSVKNLQWETVGHLVLTRSGTLHPHQPHDENLSKTGKPEPAFDPSEAIDSTLQVSEKLVNGLSNSVQKGLNAGSYSNVVDAVDTKKKIERSLWRRVCAVEEQKVARATGDTTIRAWESFENDDKLSAGDLIDQRDTSFVPNYSSTDLELWEELLCGPTPKEGWLTVMTLQERLLNCLRCAGSSQLLDSELGQLDRAWDALFEAQRAAAELLPTEAARHEQLTRAEQQVSVVSQQVLTLIKAMRANQKVEEEEGVLKDIANALSAMLEETPSLGSEPSLEQMGVGWRVLHGWYVALETCSLVHEFSRFSGPPVIPESTKATKGAGKKGKPQASSDGVSAILSQAQRKLLADAAVEVHEKVKAQAKEAKARFGEGGVLGRVLEGLVPVEGGGESSEEKEFAEHFNEFVEGAGGEAALETLVGRWLASWEDAVEGVLGVPALGRTTGKGKGAGKKSR